MTMREGGRSPIGDADPPRHPLPPTGPRPAQCSDDAGALRALPARPGPRPPHPGDTDAARPGAP